MIRRVGFALPGLAVSYTRIPGRKREVTVKARFDPEGVGTVTLTLGDATSLLLGLERVSSPSPALAELARVLRGATSFYPIRGLPAPGETVYVGFAEAPASPFAARVRRRVRTYDEAGATEEVVVRATYIPGFELTFGRRDDRAWVRPSDGDRPELLLYRRRAA